MREPAPELVVGDQVGPDRLDRDQPRPGRPGQIDLSHGARADPAEDLVASDLLRIVRLKWRRDARPHFFTPGLDEYFRTLARQDV